MRWLRRVGQTRRTLRLLERLVGAVEAQTRLLEVLVQHLAPDVPEAAVEIGFADDVDLLRAVQARDTLRRTLAREPDDAEIDAWLAEHSA